MSLTEINPKQLDWSKAGLYVHDVRQISARRAKPGEVVKGEATQSGDMVVTTNPQNAYRVPKSEFALSYEKAAGHGKYASIEAPRAVVFTTEEGHLSAPWPGHPGWDLKKGDPVIQWTLENGTPGYISDPGFSKEYRKVPAAKDVVRAKRPGNK